MIDTKMEIKERIRTALITLLVALSLGSYIFLHTRTMPENMDATTIVIIDEESRTSEINVPDVMLVGKVLKAVRRLVPAIAHLNI